jgi:uncharacterized protein YbaP (TraB family)
MRSMIATYLSPLVLILALLVFIGVPGPGFAGQGLVYRVYRDGGTQSFLVGTMHTEDQRVTGLLEQFGPLIESVDVVAVEVVPDALTLLAVGAATLLPVDQSLRGLMGDAQFGVMAKAASQLGLSVEVLDRLKPWAAAVTLGMPVSRTGRFLDMEIYLRALELRKQVIGLETAAEQLAVFDQMSMEAQLALLEEVVKNAPQMPKQLEELTTVYLQGDLKRIDQVARSQYDDMPEPIAQWFDEQLLDNRNARMLARLPALMDSTGVLVAVGAMHLAGDSGLVAGLRRLGYRVEAW